jgi:predicted glutamine amidotransferase
MCLVAAVKSGKLDNDSIQYAFINHSDGAGFAYVRDGEIVIEKGFFDVGDFTKAYMEVGEDIGPHIIHFRNSTGGLVNTINCHPFQPHHEVAFAHNGKIALIKADSHFSDTFYFSSGIMTDILRNNGATIVEANWFPWFVGEAVGKLNKLAFLTKNGKLVIINESEGEGHWSKGSSSEIWFSNYSYCYYGTAITRKGKIEQSYNSIYDGGVQHFTDYSEGTGHFDLDKMDEDDWKKYVDNLTAEREVKDAIEDMDSDMQQRFTEYEQAYMNEAGI